MFELTCLAPPKPNDCMGKCPIGYKANKETRECEYEK